MRSSKYEKHLRNILVFSEKKDCDILEKTDEKMYEILFPLYEILDSAE